MTRGAPYAPTITPPPPPGVAPPTTTTTTATSTTTTSTSSSTTTSSSSSPVMSSISKACLELSNSIRGLRLSRGSSTSSTADASSNVKDASSSSGTSSSSGSTVRTASTVSSTISRALKSATSRVKAFDRSNGHLPPPPQPPPPAATAATGQAAQPPTSAPAIAATPPAPPSRNRAVPLPPVWDDERFLAKFFMYFSAGERCVLAQVCRQWRDLLYEPHYWVGVTPVLNCKQWSKDEEGRQLFYKSLQSRAFDSICLFGATDKEVNDFMTYLQSGGKKNIRSLSLRCCNITDTGLETLLEKLVCVYRLELSGCNEITEAGLWSCLNSKIVSLSINDCINVADDSVGAIAQLLPSLYELDLQAYHVTDAALSFFSAKQSYTLSVLRLQSCWEITNHGIVNVVHSLPNLTVLSLSGCSKVTDDGVELIAENLRKLRSLDLSWCPRVTDAALEYIACDLGQLEELVLDRCSHITDIGVGYLSTMTSLTRLFLRWCTQLRDFGLQHLYTMKNLKVLSLAGCSLLTSGGLTGLIQLRGLEELELTNCPGATQDVCRYLKDNMPKCLIIE